MSSTTSCNRPAAITSISSSRSANIFATAIGWIIYGSPDFLNTPACADFANSYAFITTEAAIKLIENLGGEVVSLQFLIELEDLNGKAKLEGYHINSLIKY